MMAKHSIAIVGGGIAGLTLGRCLKARGINAVIFERSAASHGYSYSIALAPVAFHALLRNAGIDTSKFQSTAVFKDQVELPTNALSEPLRVRRSALEELLRQGLDIRWEHELEKAVYTPDGVQLKFLNGQTTLSQLVIGADGVHSQLRKHFTASSALQVLPYVAFNGKRQLTTIEWEKSSKHFTGAEPVQTLKGGVLLQAYLNHISDEGANISYTFSRHPSGPNDQCFKPNRPNSGATDIPISFYSEVDRLVELEEPFASLINSKAMGKDRLLHWLMRSGIVTASDVNSALDQNVVFVGDALHATPIIGSEGANMAIEDAVDLAECIADQGSLQQFFNERYASWKAKVKTGEERLQRLHTEGSLSYL